MDFQHNPIKNIDFSFLEMQKRAMKNNTRKNLEWRQHTNLIDLLISLGDEGQHCSQAIHLAYNIQVYGTDGLSQRQRQMQHEWQLNDYLVFVRRWCVIVSAHFVGQM